ncbi:glutathione S-transferase family protein [Agrobacterium sp. T29]|uniref:glutathione S-transferase family protein n=1 Tax=Agrobacterium sp. T29 TaxID=2580515 RepID=UPI00115DECD6|nr:glutathione S-transferase family protein [Agrobacterium sp. T29]
MKLYTSVGPNPRVVRMFAAERGIHLHEHWIDLVAGENRQAPFLEINPAGQLPALELPSGQVIAESLAICEYLDETSPAPFLIGATPENKATVRMWTRRADLAFNQPITAAFRYGPGLSVFKERVHCVPQAAEDMKAIASKAAAWFDTQLAGKDYIAGNDFSLADIVLYCFIDFAARRAGLPIDPDQKKLLEWFTRIDARSSAAESLTGTYGPASAKERR